MGRPRIAIVIVGVIGLAAGACGDDGGGGGDGDAGDARVDADHDACGLDCDGMGYRAVTAGTSHTCGIRTDGSLWC